MTSSPTDAQTDAFDSPWKDILDGWFADCGITVTVY
jgi:hypothetical protein